MKIFFQNLIPNKRSLALTGVALLCLALAFPSMALAVKFMDGDVFATVGGGIVLHYNSDFSVQKGMYDTENNLVLGLPTLQAGMAFDQLGNLYVTNFDSVGFDGNFISRFNDEGMLTKQKFAEADIGAGVESIVFDAEGNFYVGQASGTKQVIKFNSMGMEIDRFTVATEGLPINAGSDAIDLRSDQETLFYTSEGRTIKRFDLAGNAQILPDIPIMAAGSGPEAFTIRILEDPNPDFGISTIFGILVADTENIKLLDADGIVVRTYDSLDPDDENSWFALNLDPDGLSFWSGNSGENSGNLSKNNIYQFDIETGEILESTILAGVTIPGELFGLAVFGELTAALPSTQGPDPDPGNVIPEPSTVLLFGSGLLGLGLWRWKDGRGNE